MSASEGRKCPKCGGNMQPGSVPSDFRILKSGDLYGDRVSVLYCLKCGFVELYKEPSTRETWRWQREQPTPSAEEPQQQEKEAPPPEASKGRLVR